MELKMLNKKTNKIYKYKKGNIYKDTSTLTGTTTNYRIKDYFDPTKYDFSNFYNHNENYYHVVRFNDFGSCVLEYAESDLNYIFNK